ncbi:helix-turn-helix transcriptional regulator [Clostridium sp. YIM B02505]|uniref:Helix-turn-helix transcriptional regulator n=1 Tax=Clostridium yunnanense TaxID=2800325 RepID=A0ABS1ELJ4_9CLOT|nr:helix-turn-helix transcriptional regulator [Clostridium yunnanense]MBK1810234.1 helix-turn-helix transcriptional regulator [Clostridium yunnanense]
MGTKIKILRKETNITQDELAQKLGIARPILSNIE